jgi:hypothetical protein
MTTGIVAIISTWIVLAVSICWFAGGQTSICGHQSTQQDGFNKKEYSPIQIRPPPLAALELMYSIYDVFLITNENEQAISASRTYGLFYS